MEIRLARHCRHVAVVTIDNQRRLNAMRGRCCANSGVSGTSWSATSVAACLTGAGERAPTSLRGLPRSERSARRAMSEDTAAR